ncbi:MAG: LPS export ABC transporter ATP-binding protein [Aquificae bacterium]|nr:LPS export ABC transporter ATP-binding protein [Aquificota bacterium]
MLEARNLVKFYGETQVLKGVSLFVRKGEIVGLLGGNGAGKTTTFRCLIGFERPDAGKVLLDGRDITDLKPYERARLGLSFLPQEPSVFPDLTVFENVFMFAELIHPDRERARVRTLDLLKDFGLYHLKDRKAKYLSGGERRRLEIARLFLGKPKYLLLDEPFAGVDPKHVQELRRLIAGLGRQAELFHNIGILITDHNVGETLKLVHRVYIIDEGTIIFEGLPEEAVRHPEVRRKFLGEEFTL